MAFIKNKTDFFGTMQDLFRIQKVSNKVIQIQPDCDNEGQEKIIINRSKDSYSIPTKYNINIANSGLNGRIDGDSLRNSTYYVILAVYDNMESELLGFGCVAVPQIALTGVVSITSNIAEINLASNYIFPSNASVIIELSNGKIRRGRITHSGSLNAAKAYVYLDLTGDSLDLSVAGTITQMNNFAPINQANTTKVEYLYQQFKSLEPFFYVNASGNIETVYNRQSRYQPLNANAESFKLWDYPNNPDTFDQVIYVTLTGNDGNTGSLSSPLASIQKAITLRNNLSSSAEVKISVSPGDFLETAPLIIPDKTTIQGAGVLATRIYSNTTGTVNLFQAPLNVDSVWSITDMSLYGNTNNLAGISVTPFDSSSTEVVYARLNSLYIQDFKDGINVSGINSLARTTFVINQDCENGIAVLNGYFCGLGVCCYHAGGGSTGLYTYGTSSRIKIYDLDITGSINYGIAAIVGGLIDLVGVNVSGCNIGINNVLDGVITAQSIKINNCSVNSVKTANAGGRIVLNSADVRVDQVSQFVGSEMDIHGIYHDRHECAELAGIVNNAFATDIERLPQKNELSNCLIDFFDDFMQVASSSNIVLEDGNAILSSSTTDVQYENCDAITYFAEVLNAADGAISLDNAVYHEGTGSLKVSYTLSGAFVGVYRYGIDLNVSTKSGSPQDWSSYNEIKIWLKSSRIGARIRMQVHDSVSPTLTFQEYTFISTDWVQVPFNINMFTRTSVDYVLFQFTREAIAYTVNIDDVILSNTNVYANSGTLTSIIKTTAQDLDLYEMIIGVKYSLPTIATNIQMDLSLDGGTHWLTNIGLPAFENWYQTISGGALETADAGADWDDKTNVCVRFTLTTSDTSVTPYLDDYALIWRVVKA